MKNLALLVFAMLLFSTGQAQENLPEVFSAINFKVKDGHSGPEIANKMYRLNQAMKKHGKGIGMWLAYGDRGERAKQHSYGFTFDFIESRDYYFPTADAAGMDAYPQFAALQAEIQAAGVSTNMDAIEAEGGYTDFVCVGYDQLINPKIGELTGVRTLPVKADMADQFEAYVIEKVYPFYEKNMEGVNYYIYKGDRGEGKGAYIGIWSFDTVERRNSIFPKAGEGPAPEFAGIFEKITAINEMGADYIDAENASDAYTDYIGIDLGN